MSLFVCFLSLPVSLVVSCRVCLSLPLGSRSLGPSLESLRTFAYSPFPVPCSPPFGPHSLSSVGTPLPTLLGPHSRLPSLGAPHPSPLGPHFRLPSEPPLLTPLLGPTPNSPGAPLPTPL